MAANFAALKKTLPMPALGLEIERALEAIYLFGDVGDQAPIRHGNMREPVSVGFGKDAVAGFATGGVIPEPKGPDSVFVAARPGETILPRGFDADSITASVASSLSSAMSTGAGSSSQGHRSTLTRSSLVTSMRAENICGRSSNRASRTCSSASSSKWVDDGYDRSTSGHDLFRVQLAVDRGIIVGFITIAGVPYGPIVEGIGGKVRVKGAVRFYRLDVKSPHGSDGAITTYRGIAPKKFTIEFFIWTQDQYDYFEQVLIPAILYSGVKNTLNPSGLQALSVDHPALRNRQISSVEINSIGAVDPERDGPEMFRCAVEVQEYIPPPPVNVTATPSGSTGTNQASSPGRQPNPAIAANAAAAQALRDAIQARGGAPAI